MSSIEQRVVSMTFDNKNFERNIVSTIGALDKLKNSLQFAGTKQGLTDLGQAANSVDLSNIANNVDNINSKFSLLGVVGFEAIRRVTGAAIDLARNLSQKALGPLLSGGKLRAENLEQARFLFRGLGMDVEDGMKSALDAVKGTAFGLDAAAKAAAQLGGSGMQTGAEMTGALRGIAGTAAMTNTSFEEMADVFTSAAGKGKVSGYELQRIGQRGLNAAASLAKVWGTTEQEVRRMATEGEISFTMFAEGMNEAFGEHATKANETYTGSLANMRAALSRIGASFFGPDMLKMRDLFNSLTPAIDTVGDALKPLIEGLLEIKAIGTDNLISFIDNINFGPFIIGVQAIARGIKNAFDAFSQFAGAAKEAFREIFPKRGPEESIFLKLARGFESFTEKLKMGGQTLDRIKSVFRGIFSVLSIGMEIVKGVAGLFVDLFSAIADAAGLDGGGVLKFFANLGESLVNLKASLVEGGGIKDFFDNLSESLQKPIAMLGRFRESFAGLFGKDTEDKANSTANAFGRLGDRMEMIGGIPEKLGKAFNWLGERLQGIGKILDVVWQGISDWFSDLGNKLAEVMKPSDFNAAVDVVNVGLFGGIALLLKKFISGGVNFRLTTGIVENLRISFINLTRSLKAMQMDLRAKALLKIGAAVALLAGSMVVLASIDSEALTKALIAMGVGFAQLVVTMTMMEKLSMGTSSIRMGILAGGMILLAAAAGLLSVAVKNLSSLSLTELATGLAGVGVSLGIMVKAMNSLTTNTKGLVTAGIAMIGIGIALNILALAVKSFAEMSWAEMAKGLVGVGVGLGIIVGAMRLIPEQKLLAASIGIGAIAIALNILAKAVKSFSEMEWDEMGKGLFGIASGLTVIMIAVNLVPEQKVLAASVAILAISVAMNVMAEAVRSMGSIAFGEMAKGIGGIAVTLGVLAGALYLMSGTAAGAGALVVAAGGLYVLAKVVKVFSKMSLTELAVGIGAIAVILGVFAAAALLLGPVLPVLYGLGAALALIGISFALFGVGASLVAKAFETMARVGKKSLDLLVDSIKILVTALPEIVGALVNALVQVVANLLEAAPTFFKAIKVLLGHILDTVIEIVPQIVEALGVIISGFLTLVQEKVPELIETGFVILMSLLQGVRDNIVEITTLVIEILTGFVTTLTENMPMMIEAGISLIVGFLSGIAEKAEDIVAAGVELIVSFLLGITKEITRVVEATTLVITTFLAEVANSITKIITAGTDLLIALLKGISDNLSRVIDAVGEVVTTFITDIGGRADEIIQAGFGVLTDLLQGIGDNIKDVVTTVGTIIGEFVTAVGGEFERISGAGVQAFADFLEGLEKDIDDLLDAGVDFIIKLVEGITSAIVRVTDAAGQILIDFMNELSRVIENRSPELRQAGRRLAFAIADGATGGFLSKAKSLADAAVGVVKDAWNSAKGWLGINSPSKRFMILGRGMAEGVVYALNKDKTVGSSAVGLAANAVSAFQKTLDEIPVSLSDMNEFNPTIRPVLDLDKVKLGAKDLDSMMAAKAIVPSVSFSQAREISTTAETTGTDTSEPAYSGPTEVTFEQNIYSPSALTTNDIYRNTKSQLALAKEELNI